MPGVKKSQRETESIGTQQSSVPLISSHVAVLKMVVYQITLNLQKQNKTKQKQTFVLSYLRCVYVSSFYSWLSFFPSHSVPVTMNFFLTLYKTVPLTVSEIIAFSISPFHKPSLTFDSLPSIQYSSISLKHNLLLAFFFP